MTSLGRNDIIVATSEKVDSLLRNSARWIGDITLLVIDEIHLIDSDNRGPTLEMVIAKLRYRNPGHAGDRPLGNHRQPADCLPGGSGLNSSPAPGARSTSVRGCSGTTGSISGKGNAR